MKHNILKQVILEQIEVIQNAEIISRDYYFEKILITFLLDMEEKYRRRVQKVCDINNKHCVPVK